MRFRGESGVLLAFIISAALLAGALPARAQQVPTDPVYVPAVQPATGVYYKTMAAPACPPDDATKNYYFIPETYNNWNSSGTLIERGSRGPYSDAASALFGSHKIWTPAGGWNDRLILLYPLPLVIQPALCQYDGTVTSTCPKDCPDDQGLQFCYPKYNLLSEFHPDTLPAPTCTQPTPLQSVMDFEPDLMVWAGQATGTLKGEYRLPYHNLCRTDSSTWCTTLPTPIFTVKSWSDWAATFTLHADNNPVAKPGYYDVTCTFAEGSPVVFLEFSDDVPSAVLKFQMVPKLNPITGSYPGQAFLEYPSGCTVSQHQHTADCGTPVATCSAGANQFVLSGHVYSFDGTACLSGIDVYWNDNRGGSVPTKATTDATGYYCFAIDKKTDRNCSVVKDEYTVIPDLYHRSSYCFPETFLFCPNPPGDIVQDLYAGGTPGKTFGIVLPTGATQSVSGNDVVVTFGSGPSSKNWIVAVLMPDVPSGADKKTFWTNAFKAMLDTGGPYGIPRDSNGTGPGAGTRISPFPPAYDEASRTVTTTFTFAPSSPAGLNPPAAVLTGLFPHQWRTDRGNSTTAQVLQADKDGQGHMVDLTYTTSIGQVKLAAPPVMNGKASFSTCMTFPGILPEMPKVSTALQLSTNIKAMFHDVTLQQALSFEINYPWDRWADYPSGADVDPYKNNTYDTGKIMGERAVLARIARNEGSSDLYDTAITALRRDLESWLKGGKFPTDTSKQQNFLYYDQAWGMLIGYPAAYYSDAHTTDLHFHYGYWIRSAAEIARQNKSWIASWGPMVNLLAKTIANTQRSDTHPDPQSPAMPFLAFFDPYQGHSWAKGLPHAKIDQESSSEALNAWTGIILWGQEWGQAQATPDYTLRNLGIWMYTTELNSVYNYWFDVYTPHILPADWGSKGTYKTAAEDEWGEAATPHALTFEAIVNPHESALTTNFGLHPDFLSAINWLPFHGGTFYLSSDDATLQANFQSQLDWAYWNQAVLGGGLPSPYTWEPKGCSTNSKTSCQTTNATFCPKSGWSDGWAERIYMFESMQGPASTFNSSRALTEMIAAETAPAATDDAAKVASAPDLGDSISNTYYWLYNMGELGVRKEGITASSPFAMVFAKSGTGGDTTRFVGWNPGDASGPYKDIVFKDSSGTVLHTMSNLGADEVRVETVSPGTSPPGVPDGAHSGTAMKGVKASADGSQITVTFDAATCTAPGYKLIYGTGSQLPTASGGTFQVAGAACGVTASPYSWTGVPAPGPTDRLVWWLMLATDAAATTEGPWGGYTGVAERTGPGTGGSSGQCGATGKEVSNPCGH